MIGRLQPALTPEESLGVAADSLVKQAYIDG